MQLKAGGRIPFSSEVWTPKTKETQGHGAQGHWGNSAAGAESKEAGFPATWSTAAFYLYFLSLFYLLHSKSLVLVHLSLLPALGRRPTIPSVLLFCHAKISNKNKGKVGRPSEEGRGGKLDGASGGVGRSRQRCLFYAALCFVPAEAGFGNLTFKKLASVFQSCSEKENAYL